MNCTLVSRAREIVERRGNQYPAVEGDDQTSRLAASASQSPCSRGESCVEDTKDNLKDRNRTTTGKSFFDEDEPARENSSGPSLPEVALQPNRSQRAYGIDHDAAPCLVPNDIDIVDDASMGRAHERNEGPSEVRDNDTAPSGLGCEGEEQRGIEGAENATLRVNVDYDFEDEAIEVKSCASSAMPFDEPQDIDISIKETRLPGTPISPRQSLSGMVGPPQNILTDPEEKLGVRPWDETTEVAQEVYSSSRGLRTTDEILRNLTDAFDEDCQRGQPEQGEEDQLDCEFERDPGTHDERELDFEKDDAPRTPGNSDILGRSDGSVSAQSVASSISTSQPEQGEEEQPDCVFERDLHTHDARERDFEAHDSPRTPSKGDISERSDGFVRAQSVVSPIRRTQSTSQPEQEEKDRPDYVIDRDVDAHYARQQDFETDGALLLTGSNIDILERSDGSVQAQSVVSSIRRTQSTPLSLLDACDCEDVFSEASTTLVTHTTPNRRDKTNDIHINTTPRKAKHGANVSPTSVVDILRTSTSQMTPEKAKSKSEELKGQSSQGQHIETGLDSQSLDCFLQDESIKSGKVLLDPYGQIIAKFEFYGQSEEGEGQGRGQGNPNLSDSSLISEKRHNNSSSEEQSRNYLDADVLESKKRLGESETGSLSPPRMVRLTDDLDNCIRADLLSRPPDEAAPSAESTCMSEPPDKAAANPFHLDMNTAARANEEPEEDEHLDGVESDEEDDEESDWATLGRVFAAGIRSIPKILADDYSTIPKC